MSVSCPVCLATSTAYFGTGTDFLFETTDELFSLHSCGDCRCLFLDPMPDPDKIASFYPPSYWWDESGSGLLKKLESVYRRIVLLDQNLVLDSYLDDEIELQPFVRQHIFQCLGLGCGAREAVENEPVGAIWLGDSFRDYLDHDVVGHQIAGVHDSLSLSAEFAARVGRSAQHVAGRQLDDSVSLFQYFSLGAFTGTRRSEQYDVHKSSWWQQRYPRRPFNFALRIKPSYWCASKWLWICATVSIETTTTINRLVPPKKNGMENREIKSSGNNATATR